MAEITVTALTEIMYAARDIVAAEPCAFVNSVLVNGNGVERVSLGGTVTSFVTPAPTVNTSVTPSMTIPEGDAQTISTATMTIGQTANVQIPLKGEVYRQIENTAGWNAVRDDIFAQAFRAIRNTIEAHVASVAALGASRGTGSAATTPFASNHNAVNAVRQILFDNGCPMDGNISLVMDSLAGTNLRNLSNLYKVNEAGESTLLRRGTLVDISGIMLKESAGIATHTSGTASSATTDGSAHAVGATTITLASAGSGTLLAGDVIGLANDTANKYVLYSGDASTANGGTFVLNAPGLRKATGASARAITVTADFTPNVAFHKNAIELVMRPPALPPGGDAAVDRTTVYDEKSGLVFEVALYKGYQKQMLDITTHYQAKVWKPAFVALLIG